MKFRTVSRLLYLKRARHRRGHGIHSPFLFRVITTVVENKKRLPEYKIFKQLKNNVLDILDNLSDPTFTMVYPQFNLSQSKLQKLYKKVELPLRYSKVVFRLIRDFKPSSVINFGPALGANLAVMAAANNDNTVFQEFDDNGYQLVCRELLKKMTITNVCFCREIDNLSDSPEFKIINNPYDPDYSRYVVYKCISCHGDNDVLIIRGIHQSKEMECLWHELIANESVRISLDLFEIGIVLFSKDLQKENFIHRF